MRLPAETATFVKESIATGQSALNITENIDGGFDLSILFQSLDDAKRGNPPIAVPLRKNNKAGIVGTFKPGADGIVYNAGNLEGVYTLDQKAFFKEQKEAKRRTALAEIGEQSIPLHSSTSGPMKPEKVGDTYLNKPMPFLPPGYEFIAKYTPEEVADAERIILDAMYTANQTGQFEDITVDLVDAEPWMGVWMSDSNEGLGRGVSDHVTLLYEDGVLMDVYCLNNNGQIIRPTQLSTEFFKRHYDKYGKEVPVTMPESAPSGYVPAMHEFPFALPPESTGSPALVTHEEGLQPEAFDEVDFDTFAEIYGDTELPDIHGDDQTTGGDYFADIFDQGLPPLEGEAAPSDMAGVAEAGTGFGFGEDEGLGLPDVFGVRVEFAEVEDIGLEGAVSGWADQLPLIEETVPVTSAGAVPESVPSGAAETGLETAFGTGVPSLEIEPAAMEEPLVIQAPVEEPPSAAVQEDAEIVQLREAVANLQEEFDHARVLRDNATIRRMRERREQECIAIERKLTEKQDELEKALAARGGSI